jgi:hypothetical protein
MQGGYAADTNPSTQVDIHVSCRDLVRLDVFSQSDPIVRLECFNNGRWTEIGRTEWLQNQKNPNFTKAFTLDYHFEQVQRLRFSVFDIDNASKPLNTHSQDFIGDVEVTLGDICGARGQTITREIKNPMYPGRRNGFMLLSAQEVNAEAANSLVKMQFSGRGLDKKDFFGKSDPYFEIFKPQGQSGWTLVYKSEVIKKTLDPVWHQFQIDASKLCGGKFNAPLQIKVWDWDADGSSDLIGICTTSLDELAKGTKRDWELIEPELQRKKRGYKHSGILRCEFCEVKKTYSFLEYIAGGCQLRLAIAIDFTASNGAPSKPESLHYRNPTGEPNEYVKAILAVGDIVAAYDQTKMFPVFGFGAKVPRDNPEVSHCFHVNMNPSNPECFGIENVVGAYQHSLNYIKLSGPTNFAPIIHTVASLARMVPPQQQIYWVLLMITDGVISDMERTIEEIIDASDLPFSIIIVGVGTADFKDMDALDSDDRLLRSRSGKTAKRDIVQFVPFRNFKNVHYSELAKATLAELPKQLTDYMQSRNIKPNPRIQVPMTMSAAMLPPQGQPGFPTQGAPQGVLQPGPQAQAGFPTQGAPQGVPQPGSQGQGGFPAQGAPQGVPQGGWGGPQQGWGGPQQGWGGPQQGWGGPQQGWGGPQQGWGPQPQGGWPPSQAPSQQGAWGPPPQQQAGPQAGPASPQASPQTGSAASSQASPQGGPQAPAQGQAPPQVGWSPQGGPQAGWAPSQQGGWPPPQAGPQQLAWSGGQAPPQAGTQAPPQAAPQTGQAPPQGATQTGPQAPPQAASQTGQAPPQAGTQAGSQAGPQAAPQAGTQAAPQGGPQAGWGWPQGGPQGGPPAGWGWPQGGPQAGWGWPQGPQAGPQGGWGWPQGGPQGGWGGPQGGPQGQAGGAPPQTGPQASQ